MREEGIRLFPECAQVFASQHPIPQQVAAPAMQDDLLSCLALALESHVLIESHGMHIFLPHVQIHLAKVQLLKGDAEDFTRCKTGIALALGLPPQHDGILRRAIFHVDVFQADRSLIRIFVIADGIMAGCSALPPPG